MMELENILFDKIRLPKNAFKGKSTIVTGGAAGIGKQTAMGLALLGAKVAIIDKDEAGAWEVSQQVIFTRNWPCGLA